MNWVPILVGAGAGVVAVLISTAVMKLLGKQESKGATVLYVVVFAIVLAIGREFATPQIQAMRAESALLEMPIYRALQKYEPQAYERILSAIERGIAKKLPQEQIWAVTRPVITEVSARRLPHASDDVLVQFAEHLVLTTNLLYSKGGSVCFSYINPAPGEAIDFAAVLGKEFVQKELNLVANLVISAAGQTRPVITEAEVAPDLDAVIGKLLTRHSQEELSALQNLQPANLDKRKYCQIISDLYSEVLALPAPNRGRALRYFLQG